MNWHILTNSVSEFAPILGSLLGGPAGHIVGGIIASAIGLPGATPEAVQDKMSSENSWIEKVKELEQNHGSWLTWLSSIKPPSKISISVNVEFAQIN